MASAVVRLVRILPPCSTGVGGALAGSGMAAPRSLRRRLGDWIVAVGVRLDLCLKQTRAAW